MIHFLYLVGFSLLVSVAFGALSDGTSKERIIYGAKTFAQFIVISLVLAWVLYFLPW
jgi:hypothetical protein